MSWNLVSICNIRGMCVQLFIYSQNKSHVERPCVTNTRWILETHKDN